MADVSNPEQFLLIPRQDFANIPQVQKSLHPHGGKQIWLASHQEKLIMNMHRELDRYQEAPEASRH